MRTDVRTYMRTHSVRTVRIVRTHAYTHVRKMCVRMRTYAYARTYARAYAHAYFFLTNFKKKLLQMKILVKIQGFYEIPKKKNLPLSARVWPRLRADSRGKGSGKGYGEGLKR